MSYEPGDRVRDRIWGGQHTGTVARVDDDGDLYVVWDGTSFTEDQRGAADVERIGGTGEVRVPYTVIGRV